ncbi:MAG: polya polymerase [Lachnospiraceae bacterium]|uniref:Polya polymerase n=1 Tax=Hominisplanchenecus murintestinalis TaxID=2941517 RepID=A0AC61QYU0_9FIRM|nr:polya polymerase [Hominisplanchenecus murintestinalis]MCI9517421.1 polya polymerase [Lachnospiraceae bacterium]RKJ79665.1 polya polymerase [Anaerotruncus sp. 1XD22-93]MCI9661811.1 polya polymerase [Lachnospiraceae bacterium]MDE6908607.1 polya polymerase [Lachnospiraceae bacterium]NBH99549.1 polya polymerase [Lachnospiraceae bacterium]
MKLMNVKNVEKLFETVNKCNGKVELVGDDIQLNLKSKLSQYFSLAKLFSDGEIPELELVTTDPDDNALLMRFMMDNNSEM